jgi:hypothetical protein
MPQYVHKIAESYYSLCHVCLSVYSSVCTEQLSSHWTDFHEIWYWVFLKNLCRKFRLYWNLTRIMDTLHEDLCAFMIISRWILLRMRNVSDKSCEKIKASILCSITFFQKACHLWDNVEKYGRAGQASYDGVIQCTCFLCWVTKATDTHSEYVILIDFLWQQWFLTLVSMICLYVHCLSCLFSYPNIAGVQFSLPVV